MSVALGRSELDTSIMEWAELVGGAGNEEVAVQVEVPSGVDTWVKVRATNNGEWMGAHSCLSIHVCQFIFRFIPRVRIRVRVR